MCQLCCLVSVHAICSLSFTITDSKTSKILKSRFSSYLHLDIWKRVREKKLPWSQHFSFHVFFLLKVLFGQNKIWQIPWGQEEKRNLNILLEIWKTYLRVPSCNFTSTVYRLLGGAQGLIFSPTKEIKKCARNKRQSLGTSLKPACCFLGNCVWDKWTQAPGQRGV